MKAKNTQVLNFFVSTVSLIFMSCGEEKVDGPVSCTYTNLADSSLAGSLLCQEYTDISKSDEEDLKGICADVGTWSESGCSDTYTVLNKCEYEDNGKKLTSYSDFLSESTCPGTFTEGTVADVSGSCTFESLASCTSYTGKPSIVGIYQNTCSGTWAAEACGATYTSYASCTQTIQETQVISYSNSLTEAACSGGTFTAAP